MITRLFQPLKTAARATGTLARGMLWRAALMSAAGLMGAVGCGFLVFAGFASLRLVIGPELSALVVGVALLALATVLARFSLIPGDELRIKKDDLAPSQPAGAPDQPADPATLAVFTAAFVLGRWLVDWRQTNRRPD